MDILRLMPSDYLSQNELDAASLIRWEEFNSQNQPKVTWPSSIVVARAYLDQLKRSNAVNASRADAIKAALDRADRVTPRDKDAASAAASLTALAADLERDAASASGRDASRMRTLAETVKGRAAQLR
jgi:hypothetical protein